VNYDRVKKSVGDFPFGDSVFHADKRSVDRMLWYEIRNLVNSWVRGNYNELL